MQDPLNINIALEGVETSIPVLPAQTYDMQISAATIESNKNKDGHNLLVRLATTSAITSTDGREVKPGFTLTSYYPLQAKDDAKDPEFYRTKLAELLDAAFHTDKSNRPNLNRATIDQLVGKVVRATVKVEAKPDGAPGNNVARLQKAI